MFSTQPSLRVRREKEEVKVIGTPVGCRSSPPSSPFSLGIFFLTGDPRALGCGAHSLVPKAPNQYRQPVPSSDYGPWRTLHSHPHRSCGPRERRGKKGRNAGDRKGQRAPTLPSSGSRCQRCPRKYSVGSSLLPSFRGGGRGSTHHQKQSIPPSVSRIPIHPSIYPSIHPKSLKGTYSVHTVSERCL